MPRLDSGTPYDNASWLVSIADMPQVYWTTVSTFQKNISRATWADPLSGIIRHARSGSVSFENITLTKTMLRDSTNEGSNWDIIRQLNEWLDAGTYLSASMTPIIRNGEIELIGDQSIQLNQMLVASIMAPGEINVSDGTTVSEITATFTVEVVDFGI